MQFVKVVLQQMFEKLFESQTAKNCFTQKRIQDALFYFRLIFASLYFDFVDHVQEMILFVFITLQRYTQIVTGKYARSVYLFVRFAML